jgi:hypothetical protein
MNRIPSIALAAALCFGSAHAQQHDPALHMQHRAQAAQTTQAAQAVPKDTRQVVNFPKALREHTLANMRDHLLALQEIQAALAKQEYDRAGDIAERRLGMSSLQLHGAHDVAKYMPKGMQDAGTALHRNASRFAVAAKDAAATGDVGPALAALASVTAQCVACHAGYRVK